MCQPALARSDARAVIIRLAPEQHMRIQIATTITHCALGAILAVPAALACRYNVRDAGFVDLDEEPYHLYVRAPAAVAPETARALEETAQRVFEDCNVWCEVLRPETDPDHPGLDHFHDQPAGDRPTARLVSPDGQTLAIAVPEPGPALASDWAQRLEPLVTSAKREEMVRVASETFAAVVLFEGADATENQAARAAILEGIETVRTQMEWLPKAIAKPPALVVVGAAERALDTVLEWSLGIEAERRSELRAAVIYGRARWIGPLMTAAEISALNVARLVSIIGADCECGMDISWTRGTRLPVRWPAERHAAVTRELGFDPESPMVKMEVARIVGRSSFMRGMPLGAAGYREIELGAVEPPSSNPPPAVSPRPRLEELPDLSETNRLAAREAAAPPAAEPMGVWTGTVWTAGGLTLAIVAAGVWLVLRAARKQRDL